jgi:hypothetical protein
MMIIKSTVVPQVLEALKKHDEVAEGADIRTAFRALGWNIKIAENGDIIGLKYAGATQEQATKLFTTLNEFAYFGSTFECKIGDKPFTWIFAEKEEPAPEAEPEPEPVVKPRVGGQGKGKDKK